MANIAYITAGLPRPKTSGQDPDGTNTAYITAGLPKIVEEAAPSLSDGALVSSLNKRKRPIYQR
jgi:hypothetical protein